MRRVSAVTARDVPLLTLRPGATRSAGLLSLMVEPKDEILGPYLESSSYPTTLVPEVRLRGCGRCRELGRD